MNTFVSKILIKICKNKTNEIEKIEKKNQKNENKIKKISKSGIKSKIIFGKITKIQRTWNKIKR